MSNQTDDKIGSRNNKESYHQPSNNWQFIRIHKGDNSNQQNSIATAPNASKYSQSVDSISSEDETANSEEETNAPEDISIRYTGQTECKPSSPLLSQVPRIGAAFVPLSDRIPRFLRTHKDSEFVIMATPREGVKRCRSIDKTVTRPTPSQSTSQEQVYLERGRRRSSQLVSHEDIEYCSALEPLQNMDSSGHLYPRRQHNYKKKQSRPLRKQHEFSCDETG